MPDIMRSERLISVEQISKLPRWGQVAFAARCARRLMFAFEKWIGEDGRCQLALLADHSLRFEIGGGYKPAPRPSIVKDAVSMVEAVADNGGEQLDLSSFSYLSFDLYDVHTLCNFPPTSVMPAKAAAVAAWAAVRAACQAYSYGSDSRAASEAATAANLCLENIAGVDSAIQSDLRVIKNIKGGHMWSKTGYGGALAANTVFDFDDNDAREHVADVSDQFSRELISYFSRYPERLNKLEPRQFEELIAQVWSKFGYEVQLTQRTRDGGSDIIAVRQSPANIMLMIECKRWNQNVGVKIVRELHGVVTHRGATKGIIATTSSFTKDAKTYLDSTQTRWKLEGADLDRVIDWLRLYQNILLGRAPRQWSTTSRYCIWDFRTRRVGYVAMKFCASDRWRQARNGRDVGHVFTVSCSAELDLKRKVNELTLEK